MSSTVENSKVNPPTDPQISAALDRLKGAMSDDPVKLKATVRSALTEQGGGASKVYAIGADHIEPVRRALLTAIPLHLANVAPLIPIPRGKKATALQNWPKLATQNPKTLRRVAEKNPDLNWGLVCNAIDIDKKHDGLENWAKFCAENGGEPNTRKAITPSGGIHYIVTDQLDNSTGKIAPGIDTKGAGKGYIVGAGSFVEADGKGIRATGVYKWMNDKPPGPAPASIKAQFANAKAGAEREEVAAESLLDEKQAREMLFALDPADYRDEAPWFRMMCSFHYATGGQFFDVFREWSESDSGYTGNPEFEPRWRSLGIHDKADTDEHVLFEAVRDAGRADLVAKILMATEFSDSPGDEDSDGGESDDDTTPKDSFPEPLDAATMCSTEYVPSESLIEGLVLKGHPQPFYGDGGIGKSLLSAQKAVHVAAGRMFFGRKVIQSPVLFVTHEDDIGEVKKRMTATAKNLDVDLATLPLKTWCLQDHDITLARIDDVGKATLLPFHKRLKKQLAKMPGALVILDCLTDIVEMNEILRPPPNTLYKGILMKLCKTFDVTIIVLGHPSKASIADGSMYSGGTGMRTAVRNMIQMKLKFSTDPNGPRLFGPLKRQYGPLGKLIEAHIDPVRGIFVGTDDAKVKKESEDLHDVIIGKVLRLIESGVMVCDDNRASKGQQTPDDIATALHAEGCEASPRDVYKALKRAIREFVLIRADTRNGRVPAHLVLPPERTGPNPVNDFEGDEP